MTLTPPDFSTEAGRAAYMAELKGVAMLWRALGFAIVIAGVGLLFLWRFVLETPVLMWVAVATLVLGWVLLGIAIVKRTLYHRRRMRLVKRKLIDAGR